MKDNLNEYNVTCYVTVAVTVHGVKSATAEHAAMSTALAVAEELDGYDCRDLFDAGLIEVEDEAKAITFECDGSDIDGFLVETADGQTAEILDKNGNPAPLEMEEV